MFNLISKTVDSLFEKEIVQNKQAASNEVKGFDLLEQLLAEYGYGGNYWSEANYPAYSFQGYGKNPVVNFCISQISDAAAGIKFILKRNGTEVTNTNDDLMRLLRRPNPLMSYSTFIKYLMSYKMISGNTFIWAISVGNANKKITEMHTLRPDRVQVIPNSFSLPLEYIYTINGKATIFPCDPLTFESEILQIKYFHPLNDLYGLSPVQVAIRIIDQHNEANEWNDNLLKNKGKPSGVYNIKSLNPLLPDQQADILRKINAKNQGPRNAGNDIVAGIDMEYTPLSLTPAEMDWIESKGAAAREICLTFKMPPYMLGLKDGSTFNNMAEARMSFYEETVIPMTENVLDELAYYISRLTKQNIELIIDKDRITALAPRRDSARANAINGVNAGIISIDEAREEIDYKPLKIAQSKVPMVPAGKLPLDFDVSEMANNPNPDKPAEGDPAKD